MNLSEPIPLDLTLRAFVYHLWDANDNCLYIGQHVGFHPGTRVSDHYAQDWWPEVARQDYIEVSVDSVSRAEKEQTASLQHVDCAVRYYLQTRGELQESETI